MYYCNTKRCHFKIINLDQRKAFLKLMRFCVYQERCEQEVRKKLRDLMVVGEDADMIVEELVTENFLNEKRYVHLYVSNKFRLKKWGRVKIRKGLHEKKVPRQYIEPAFEEEIEEEDYQVMIKQLIQKKIAFLRLEEPLAFKDRQKVVRYLLQKGYEMEEIKKVF